MELHTTRFGSVDIEPDDILHFPGGMLGLEGCRHWVLLADAQNDALGWLQCASRADVALAVVSPRRFVAGYQARVARCEIAPLGLEETKDARVLVIVSKNDHAITLNLKAPLVINLSERLGCQVVTSGDQSVQYELQDGSAGRRETPSKKIA